MVAAGLMTETQVYQLMKHKSGGVLPLDRFGFIQREENEVTRCWHLWPAEPCTRFALLPFRQRAFPILQLTVVQQDVLQSHELTVCTCCRQPPALRRGCRRSRQPGRSRGRACRGSARHWFRHNCGIGVTAAVAATE